MIDDTCTTEKAWGVNHEIHRDADLHVTRIEVRRGGYCSRHRHKSKANAFLVIQGRLKIVRYQSGGQTRTTLTPESGIHTVPAGVEHRFLALEAETMAYEFYHRQSGRPLAADDIVRRDVGGILPTAMLDQEDCLG